jgi:hypothetical protein
MEVPFNKLHSIYNIPTLVSQTEASNEIMLKPIFYFQEQCIKKT